MFARKRNFAFQIVFVVTSDDVEWCKLKFRAFKSEIFHYVADFYPKRYVISLIILESKVALVEYSSLSLRSRPDFQSHTYDLAVLSRTHHLILDYGTFGYWAAYLNGRGIDANAYARLHTLRREAKERPKPVPRQVKFHTLYLLLLLSIVWAVWSQ